MSYTNGLDKPTDYFNTKLYTGNGSSNAITGVGFQPDWVWLKYRGGTGNHRLVDAVRGTQKRLMSNATNAESTETGLVTSFDSDGFTLNSSDAAFNGNSNTYVSWNWSAGGSAPAITYSVKVVSDSGNKYRFDDFGTSAVTLDLQEGGTYTFDQSDSSNSGHPLRFSTTSNGTHGGGSEYTTGVTTTGTPGNSGAKTVITVAASAPTLYYYCTQHSAMGGQANTNSTFGSSNFSGSIQSTVSSGITQGMSIVSYTGNGTTNATVGHGLGVTPNVIWFKRRDSSNNWINYFSELGTGHYLTLNTNGAKDSASGAWCTPGSSTFQLNQVFSAMNTNTATYIAYCFAEKKGYSKFGSYTGNGNADGTFVYLGFKPAFVIIKQTNTTGDWMVLDNKRDSDNGVRHQIYANTSGAESVEGSDRLDFLSNGIKHRSTGSRANGSGGTYIYLAFAESPFTNSNGVPTNAR